MSEPASLKYELGQVAVPVQDVERATAFYRDVIGLEHLFSAPPGLSFFRCGSVRLMLSRPEDPALRGPAGKRRLSAPTPRESPRWDPRVWRAGPAGARPGTGEHLQAVGPVLDLDPRNSPPILDAAVGQRGIWVLLPPARIELWAGSELRRRFEWSEDWLVTVDGSYRDRASDAVVDMQAWEDRRQQRLWVMTIVHQPRSSAPGFERQGPGGAMSPDAFGPSSLQQVFNTVISVIDLNTGAVLAHENLDEAAVQFLNDGRLLVARDDAQGYLWAEAWELRLTVR